MQQQNAILKGILGGIAALVFFGGLFYVFSNAYHGFQIASGVETGQEELNKAKQLYKENKFTEAALLFARLRVSPTANSATLKEATDGEVFCYRSLAHLVQKTEPQTALRWYEKALNVSPGDVQAKAEYEALLRFLNAQKDINPSSSAVNAVNNARVSGSESRVGDIPDNNPRPALPGTPDITQQDFARQNAQKAQEAEKILAKATAAWQQGDTQKALSLWSEASVTAPGSPAAITSQKYLLQYNTNNPAFGN